jgi:glucose-6-phosphate isomerase
MAREGGHGEIGAVPDGWSIQDGGGMTVAGAASVPGVADAIARLVADEVPAKLLERDPTLWGPAAEDEARIRLGWIDLARTSRDLVPRLTELRRALVAEGLDRVVLAGMGGSSLAPEVITRTLGVELTVLDTTDPYQVRTALADRLDRTVVVVSSKSGSTVETDSHRRAFHQAFTDSGLSDSEAGRRFVVVTDPGSGLERIAMDIGAREVFLAEENVGGRYSALTAFGLVPAALAGVDVTELLDQAAELHAALAEENPALTLGAALGAAAGAGRDKVALADDGTGIVGLGDWAEQLIAESTGKDGRGILPVVVENPMAVGTAADDVLAVTVGGALGATALTQPSHHLDLAVNAPLGAQFLAWEVATAVAGRMLGINPFDQPNVTESKDNTRRILVSGPPAATPAFTDGTVEVYADAALLAGAADLAGALAALSAAVPARGYLAVMAYLDRVGQASAADLRSTLAGRLAHPVTFGWGPRFLHSTGQYHKGGPQVGAFLQITGAVTDDLPVPGQPYTFGRLQAAQAAGDWEALTSRGRPALRVHLTDRAAGLERLLAAARGGGS